MSLFKVKAIFEYASPHEDDLNFPANQIITVTDEEDADWYGGEYVDDAGVKHEGIFSRNFVERYEPQAPPAQQDQPKEPEQVASPEPEHAPEPVRSPSPTPATFAAPPVPVPAAEPPAPKPAPPAQASAPPPPVPQPLPQPAEAPRVLSPPPKPAPTQQQQQQPKAGGPPPVGHWSKTAIYTSDFLHNTTITQRVVREDAPVSVSGLSW
ncbi:assembly of actin patch protein [Neurospora sp. IMI 360204]|nr:assembly of actin patch protein [Neurospora sp. IMI 360204]